MVRFRWGIFGTGAISTKFVAGLAAAQDAEVAFVASRSLAKAQEFVAGIGCGRPVEGYAEAAAAGGVDAIYVATPPSLHKAHTLLCVEAGIPALVEKPFAGSAAEAAQIAAAARARSVFVMEAMWTRFLPAARALKDLVLAQSVGDIRMVTGNFGMSYTADTRNPLFDPALGGGALAHLGSYPISLSQWLFGSHRAAQAIGRIGASGVEEEASFSLQYDRGVIGSFAVSLRAWAPDQFQLLGDQGMISLRGSIVRPIGLDVTHERPLERETAAFGWRARMRQHGLVHQMAQRMNRSSRAKARRHEFRYAGNGYHYEADEVRRCVASGAIESEIMSLSDTVAVAEAADAVREILYRRGN